MATPQRRPKSSIGTYEREKAKRDGAMYCFRSREGNKVYVDPALVAFVEERENDARIVFSGGAELFVDRPSASSAHEIIRAWKQGESI